MAYLTIGRRVWYNSIMTNTETRTIDYDEALAALKQALVDPRLSEPGLCKYTTNDDKHCIVGTALVILGVPLPDRHALDCNKRVALNGKSFRSLVADGELPVEFDPAAVDLLGRVQADFDMDIEIVLP